ncbi:C6 zinc finger domain-containing protein [Fusarium tricinctum]|uniref:C6 zinc finger domain-containing protein n=1 Tax=Fusarium tricinctum TaxID=61284 RepID=A0A8K0RYD8_9HYPO|nr:C6 zinc finger domain-containing protein [Fusarium tricinctum]
MPPATTVVAVNGSAKANCGDLLSLGVTFDADRLSPKPLSAEWNRDLELMHHYSTITCNTLALREDMRDLWRVIIPQVGYSHPFVLHGLLAISALHKSYLIPSKREIYLKVSTYYQSLGLEGFRPFLREITKHNWKPAFCYATIEVLYSCSLPARLDHKTAVASITNVLDWFRFLREIRSVLQPFIEYLPGSNFAPLAQGVWIVGSNEISECDPSLEKSSLPNDVFDALRHLGSFFQSNIRSDTYKEYEKAVLELLNSAKLMAYAGLHVECGMILFWPYFLPETIIVDMQVHNPYALVLLSYFAVFLRVMEERFWFIKGWGIRLYADIEIQLADQQPFLDLLKWPKEQVFRPNGH